MDEIRKWMEGTLERVPYSDPDYASLFVFTTLSVMKTEEVISHGEAREIMKQLMEGDKRLRKEFWK
jgi:hypothetical protein